MIQQHYHVNELCWILSMDVSGSLCPLSSIPALEVSRASSPYQGAPHLPHHLPHHDSHHNNFTYDCQSNGDWNRKVLKQTFFIKVLIAKLEFSLRFAGLLMILTSVPVYLILIKWDTKPRWLEKISTDSTNWLMRLLVVMPQNK